MIYVYKEENKFPHVIYHQYGNLKPNRHYTATEFDNFYVKVRLWCRENIGAYHNSWFISSSDSSNIIGVPFAFKEIESAMAFKLRWV